MFDQRPPASADKKPVSVPQDLRPPSIALGDLFAAIHDARIFTDPKAVADAIPDQSPADLVAAWKQQKDLPGFNLKLFVSQHFTVPVLRSASYSRKPGENVRDYITGMWDVLTRDADAPIPWSSLLPLPHKYIVPGGRFSEIYYWDTYFTMIGLYEDERIDLMRNVVRDIASLIDRYGHMPNGNRTYYLGRSQPPFFSVMLDLLASHDGQVVYTSFLPTLQREYDYWTDGAATLQPGSAWRHVVKLSDGTVMFRPWDDMNTPRDESFPQDQETARQTHRNPNELWRDLRAGAETGWDYSSRWLADGKTLSTIQATSLITIEYNCLIVHLMQTLSHAYALSNDKTKSAFYAEQAKHLQAAINHYLWNAQEGAYYDYNWKTLKQLDVLSTATAVPLFLHLAPQENADAVANTIEKRLLHVGGLTVTDRVTGQQWDSPNGWAPEQWMAIKGLEQYGHDSLAAEIGRRWMARVIGTFEKSGVLLEKYDVVSPEISPTGGKGGGEYPMQVGFGWTNGTLLGLMNRYPQKTRTVLDKNPMADQESQKPLPPVDAWDAKGPDIPVTEKSPLKGVPLSALHTEDAAQDEQNQKSSPASDPHDARPLAPPTENDRTEKKSPDNSTGPQNATSPRKQQQNSGRP
ncbi:alpha,alpha-trehalase TreF [Acetobacter indonesiensis]|uniref:alpha,alpha-trehalase TreF n=1 Tax=Acetobacter indonesiensis TaxID=104101 RepID=UPI001F00A4DF|nr:alpha,alpha-trehalase TreF [Acetobacter indonesiensis]MCG0994765.1 alpha,alpha-trehalase TreF [Acetobacter indonesiensis]